MKPREKSKPAEISPELFKTSRIWPQHYESDLINNDPMAGVKGINIERTLTEKQNTFYQTKKKERNTNRSKRVTPDLIIADNNVTVNVEGWRNLDLHKYETHIEEQNADLPKTNEEEDGTATVSRNDGHNTFDDLNSNQVTIEVEIKLI